MVVALCRGCAKQEAMALCRGRAGLLAVAVGHRDAHAALAGSLLSISSSLHLLLVSATARSAATGAGHGPWG